MVFGKYRRMKQFKFFCAYNNMDHLDNPSLGTIPLAVVMSER